MVKEKENKMVNSKIEYLPTKLIEALTVNILSNSTYEYRTKNNFIKCIGLIVYHNLKGNYGLYGYVPLGRSFWKKVFGGDYHERVLNPLLKLDVIQSRDFKFSTFNDNNTIGKQNGTVSIRYRVNPNLLNSEFAVLPYLNKGKVISAEEEMLNGGSVFDVLSKPNKNFHVTIDRNKAIDWVTINAGKICDEYMNHEFVNLLPDNLQINTREYLDEGSYHPAYSTIKYAKNYAHKSEKELFYFKDTFYIASVEDFLQQREAAIKHHYQRDICKIGDLPIVDKRNGKTLRVSNQLVNFPSKILQFININNQTVVQIDLRTSQFLLFANLLNIYISQGGDALLKLFKHKTTKVQIKRLIRVLESHESVLPKVGVEISNPKSLEHSSFEVIKFIRDVFFTDFYDTIKTELQLPERSLAKHLLFKLLFKRSTRPDELFKKLTVRYPIVMSIINGFKEPTSRIKAEKSVSNPDQDNNFSVFLQCVESEIFVDNILFPLREQGIPCFTRHDSVVVACSYEDKVVQHMKQVFHNFGFKYNSKTEDKYWEVVDEDDLEESDYMQWLIDEEELNMNFPLEEGLEFTPKSANESIIITANDVLTINNKKMLDEEDLNLMERLGEIGFHDDYFDYVNSEMLSEITDLPLDEYDKRVLAEEINNIKDGMSFFQSKTNELLNFLIGVTFNNGVMDEIKYLQLRQSRKDFINIYTKSISNN